MNLRIIYLFLVEYIRTQKLKTFFSFFGIALSVGLFVSTNLNGKRAEEAMLEFSLGQFGKNYEGKLKSSDKILDDEFIEELFYSEKFKVLNQITPRIQKSAYTEINSEIVHFNFEGIDLLKERKFFNSEFKNKNFKLEKAFISKALFEKINSNKIEFILDNKKFLISDLQVIDEKGLFIIEDLFYLKKRLGIKNYSFLLLNYEPSIKTDIFLKKEFEKLDFETRAEVQNRSSSALKSFHLNLIIISLVSILIAFFMVSNSMSGIFLSRKKEFGIFRCLGISKSENLILFISQTLVLGITGTIFGILFGNFLSNLDFFSGESTLLDKNLAKSYTELSPDLILISLALGILGSVFSGIIPALKSYSIEAILLVREVQNLKKFENSKKFFIFGIILLAFSIYLSKLKSPFPLPIFGFVAIGLIILSLVLCFPFLMETILVLFNIVFKKFNSSFITLRIGFEEIVFNSLKNSLTAATLMLGVSLILCLSTLTDSYEKSITDWTDREFPYDYSIINYSDVSTGTNFGVPENLKKQILNLENIKDVDVLLLNTKAIINGKTFTLHGYNLELGKKLEMEFGKNKNTYPEKISKNEVLISSNMSYLQGYKIGDILKMDTLKGKIDFKIIGIREHFFSELGTVMISDSEFEEYFGVSNYRSIRFSLRDKMNFTSYKKIEELIYIDKNLKIISKEELKSIYISGVRKVFTSMNSLKYTAVFISLVSLLSSILYNLLEKIRALASLKAIGGSNFQLIKILFFENLFLSFFGIFTGVILSLILNPIILDVINKSAFGWNLIQANENFLIILCFISSPILSLIGTIYPAFILISMNLKKVLSYE